MGKPQSVCFIPVYTLVLRPVKFSTKVVKGWELSSFLNLASFPKLRPALRAASFVGMVN